MPLTIFFSFESYTIADDENDIKTLISFECEKLEQRINVPEIIC